MCKWLNKGFVFFTFLSLVLYIFPLSSMSQEFKPWKNLGIYGGTIYDIAIDPSDPNRVFAGSFMGDGVFLTEDGGNNWQSVEASNGSFREDTFKNHAVYAVKIAPGNPKVVWVAHDFWVEKSMDGGQTWTHISNSEMQLDCNNCGDEDDGLRICRSLVIDPIDPNIVYVGTSGPNHSYSSGTIYKTGDGGSTWEKIGFNDTNEFDYMVMDMDIDPQDPNIIWAVTNSEGDEAENQGTGTLYRSGNSGGSWKEIFPSMSSSSTSGFFTVAVDPNDYDTVFTGSSSGMQKHYRSKDKKWTSDPVQISENCLVRDITFDPIDPNVIYAAWMDPNSLFMVARSIDGGESWDLNEVEYEFLTLAVHPSIDNIIFGGELNLGIYKSQDRGKTWESINNGINAMIVNDIIVDPNDSNHIFTGTRCGVYEKKQNKHWSRLTQEETSIIAFHPTNTQILYAGVEGRLGKSTDGGNHWIYSAILDDGENYVSSIAIDPADPNTLFISVAGNGNYGRIYKSKNQNHNGEDWFGDPVLTSSYNFNVVAIDPSDSNHIFAGDGGYYDTNVVLGNLYESKEGGDFGTWDPNRLTDVIVNTLLIDPEDPNTIYVGCSETKDKKTILYSTEDGGDEWESSCKDMHKESSPKYGPKIWGGTLSKEFIVIDRGSTILHNDEGSYTIRSDTEISYSGIWGGGPTNFFVAGDEGAISHYNGDTWTEMEGNTTADLSSVWGASSDDVFTVGSNGTILYYNGNIWSPMVSGTNRWLGGIWGTSLTNIFVAGEEGTILHYNGDTWTPMESGIKRWLGEIWGTSSTDIFVAGEEGTILHYNGDTWTEMEGNTTANLSSVWGASSDDVFAVGSIGTILHYDGSVWSAMNSNTNENLTSVWGISSTEVFAASDMGTILEFDGNTWTRMRIRRRREQPPDIREFSESDIFMPMRLRSSEHSHDKRWPTGEFGRVTRRSVTDLAFHPKDKNIIYSSTMTNGVFVSTDQGSSWHDLVTLPYYVYGIAIGTLNIASVDVVSLQYIISGYVRDDFDMGIPGAIIKSNLGSITFTFPSGRYKLDVDPGTHNISATVLDFMDKMIQNVEAYGNDPDSYEISLDICMQRPPIQPRIDDANDIGDIIYVKPGIYYENIDFKGKSVTLTSDPNDPNAVAITIIDGNQVDSVVTFKNGEGIDSIIRGFTLQNGHNINGGGIFCDSSSPIISNCIIKENSAVNNGGGIYCDSSYPIISNCIIKENSAENNGGGIYGNNSMPMINNATMLMNIMFKNKASEQPNQIYLNINSTIVSDREIINCGSAEDVFMKKKDNNTGKWEAYYRFFGKPCGCKIRFNVMNGL